MGRQTATQTDEDFGVIDLIREMPTAVAYAALVATVPAYTRNDLFDALHEWEIRHGQQVVS